MYVWYRIKAVYIIHEHNNYNLNMSCEYHEWFYLSEPSDFEIMTCDTIITETEGYCDRCLHIAYNYYVLGKIF